MVPLLTALLHKLLAVLLADLLHHLDVKDLIDGGEDVQAHQLDDQLVGLLLQGRGQVPDGDRGLQADLAAVALVFILHVFGWLLLGGSILGGRRGGGLLPARVLGLLAGVVDLLADELGLLLVQGAGVAAHGKPLLLKEVHKLLAFHS